MAMQTGASDDEVVSAINATPLVDVMLVLLIVFLITIPVVVHTIPVSLPTEKAQQMQPVPVNIVLAVDQAGVIFWEQQQLSEAQLLQQLKQSVAQNPQVIVQIRGDQHAKYEAIAKVLAATRTAGITAISFVTQPKS